STGTYTLGRYTKSIENYKLTVPHKLTPDGVFHSFNLPQRFVHETTRNRRRRSDGDQDMVHYGVTLGGKVYHVELRPNHDFISPDLVVEHRDPKLKVGKERMRRLDRNICHYTGHVRGHRNSRAALSTCDGLAGYITVDNERYFIEPVEDHQANSEGHHLHVVHQSIAGVNKGTNRCGTTSDWQEAWKKRFREQILKEGESNKEKRGAESVHTYLETLVVADNKFITHHNNRDTELYIMTIMNMISGNPFL
ncbi:A disintegrin and metalloproteinase with thrombospondin motifs 12, partial [Gonioctena quinquepunctata]